MSSVRTDRSWNPFVRGWSLLLQTILRREYLALHEALSYAEEAQKCFADGASALGEALAYRELGEQLVSRRQPGDVERAFTCFERSLTLVERLQAESPEDRRATRDVAVALDRMAQFHHELRGNSELALQLFERSHAIWERLLAASPADERAMRDVSVSLNKIGDVYFELAQGPDYDRALDAYRRSLEIDESNFARNPQNVIAARAYAVSLSKRAQAQLQSESIDLKRTAEDLEKFLDVVTRVYASTPKNPSAAWDVAVAHYQLAQYHRRRSDEADAAEHYAASLDVLRKFEDEGWPMDAHIRRMYDQLKQTLASS